MQVITFASTKGGVGKSTMAAIAADGFLRRNETVRIIDLDQQGSLRRWALPVAERNDALKVSRIDLKEDATFAHYYNAMIDVFQEETDWVLIDTKGSDDFRSLAALAISDLVLCPSGPVEIELQGVQKTVDYLGLALREIGAETDPLDMLRVLYQKPNGFPNQQMLAMRELIFNHFGAVDEMHQSSSIATFIDCKMTTEEAIAEGRDPKPFRKIQEAADRLTQSLKGQFDE